jgi:hypothetical protein
MPHNLVLLFYPYDNHGSLSALLARYLPTAKNAVARKVFQNRNVLLKASPMRVNCREMFIVKDLCVKY